MPTIEFPSTEVNDLWGHRVLGVMLFPENDRKRLQFGKVRDHKLLLQCLPKMQREEWSNEDWKAWSLYLEDINKQLLLDNLSPNELVNPTSIKTGMVAGAYLFDIFLIELSGFGGSGIKAEHLVDNHPYVDDDGKGLPHSTKSIRSAWRTYKHVGHMWSAMFLFETLLNKEDEDPLSNENIEQFLTLSEYFRRLGENLKPGNTGVSVLDPSSTWKPPTNINLPEVSFDIGSLSEEEKRSINEYLSKSL
jgi:hypothetical protein